MRGDRCCLRVTESFNRTLKFLSRPQQNRWCHGRLSSARLPRSRRDNVNTGDASFFKQVADFYAIGDNYRQAIISVLKFIEWNWGIPKPSTRSRDNLPNPVQPSGYVPINGAEASIQLQ